MTLQKISTQKIDQRSRDIKAVFCVRNEGFRLPYFLEYYRNLGVSQFFAVDNGSTDGTQLYLLEQPDVHVFYTDQEYKSSNAGRDWTHELAHKYCQNSWCLTLDVDEFLVYPHSEVVDLKKLTKYLDSYHFTGLFSVFLDLYSDRPLSQTSYTPGESPFDVCQYYDKADNYTCYEGDVFPYLEVKGGPRRRVFWPGEKSRGGPSMRKLVLIKWHEKFQYTHSTHSCVPIRLADITGAVAHFKFLSHFAAYAQEEVRRNGRIANSIDWKAYASELENNDVCFHSPDHSRQFERSSSLIAESIIRSSEGFDQFCYDSLSSKSTDKIDKTKRIREEENNSNLNEIVHLWPAFSSFSDHIENSTIDSVVIKRFERDIRKAANSPIWRASYPLRKFASRIGLTDQRSLTEETFFNQSLHAKFVFTYKSIWWDILAPARIVQKIYSRLKRKSN